MARTTARSTARPPTPPPLRSPRRGPSGTPSCVRPATATPSAGADSPRATPGRRAWVVAGVLLAGLASTTGLLRVLSPDPLRPDAAGRLLATVRVPVLADAVTVTSGDPLDPLLQTRVDVDAGRWQTLRVRFSGTSTGDATTLAELARARGIRGVPDHFVIGNGLGCGDGEIQFTSLWDEQRPAAGVGRDVLTVCLIGDPTRSGPSATQVQRLEELMRFLHEHLGVVPTDHPDPAGGLTLRD